MDGQNTLSVKIPNLTTDTRLLCRHNRQSRSKHGQIGQCDLEVQDTAAKPAQTARTKLATPGAPTSSAKTIKTITVNWVKIANATGYTITYRNTTDNLIAQTKTAGNVATYQLTDLAGGRKYSITVTATATNIAPSYVSSDPSTELIVTTN